MKGDTKTYSFDYSAWAADNNDISSMTWTIKAGQATISDETLTSNVAQANISFPEEGRSLIQVTADTGTQVYVSYIDIASKDPEILTDDYGVCYG